MLALTLLFKSMLTVMHVWREQEKKKEKSSKCRLFHLDCTISWGNYIIEFCRYNFDIVNDLPLSGRYEWVRVIPWVVSSSSVLLFLHLVCHFHAKDSGRSDLHLLALYNLIIYLPCKLMLSEWKPWKMFNSKICNTTELVSYRLTSDWNPGKGLGLIWEEDR
jgi:hypothetical protein